MFRAPPRSTRTDTLFPYTTLFRSAFFEAAMARLGNVQLKNAKKLIHEGGDLGLRSLYEKAKMPERLFGAVRAAVQILAEEDYDGRSEEHTSELQSLMRSSFAVFCLKKKTKKKKEVLYVSIHI